MSVVKPAVCNNPPITVTTTQQVSNSAREIVGIHYVNSTAGLGLVKVHNGTGNEAIYLGSDANGGNDSFTPAQPVKFTKVYVEFVNGTGYVSLVLN